MAFRASVSPKGRYRGAAWTPLEAARGAAQLAAMGAQDWWEAGASGNLSTWERMHTEQNHAQGHGDNGPRRRRRKAPSQLELFVRALSLMLAGLFALRLLHLIMEARSVILTERANEAEFMQDCRSGRAASSRFKRESCAQAIRENAGWALLRAVERGFFAFGKDVGALICSPFRAGAWLTIMSAMSLLPWLSVARSAFWPSVDSSGASGAHRVVIVGADTIGRLPNPAMLRSVEGPPSTRSFMHIGLDEESGFEDDLKME